MAEDQTNIEKKKSEIDLKNISAFEHIQELGKRSDVAKNLYRVLQSKSGTKGGIQIDVEKLYQIDDVEGYNSYSGSLKNDGGGEIWLFYACPTDMAEKILTEHRVLPYSDFFPAVLGRKAIYLYENASQAARVAFKFGIEKEGFLFSCRLNLGKLFKTNKGNPQADKPPKDYDTIFARKGTNLGDGAIGSDLYAVYDSRRILLRYAIHIKQA